jgi:glyoxylase-like metal-dependent hydrolase (beta-lactamase superfamily II)
VALSFAFAFFFGIVSLSERKTKRKRQAAALQKGKPTTDSVQVDNGEAEMSTTSRVQRVALGALALVTMGGLFGTASSADTPPPVQIGTVLEPSRVPSALRQGVGVPPQSVSAIDVSDDGRFVAVGTMAGRHDRNFWLLSAETGEPTWGRYVETWAPAQVRVLAEGKGFAVGLTYGPVTSVGSTVGMFRGAMDSISYTYDWPLVGGRGWLRYGGGDWRTGWPASVPADLFARAGETLFASADANHSRSVWKYDGGAAKPLNLSRPFRMAASADGQAVAFGYPIQDFRGIDAKIVNRFDNPARGMIALRTRDAEKEVWIGPKARPAATPKPPEPSDSFPALAEDFHLKPLAQVPFRIPMSIAVAGAGAKIAVTEYGGHARVGQERIFPRWSPRDPIMYCPRQRGQLRVFASTDNQSKAAIVELVDTELPADGLFDVHLNPPGNLAWCVPASWFARGLAGCPWLPADEAAHTVFIYDVAKKAWQAPWRFPDAISDLAFRADGMRTLVSCWDGMLYLLNENGGVIAKLDVGGPARVRWEPAGTFAVAGTQDGTVVRLNADGGAVWRKQLPADAAPPPGKGFGPVFKELPVYSVGRVGPEHAYVGDIWLIKTAEGGILVDTGGASAQAASRERIKAAGVDPKDIRYVLLSHSHGDHAGAAYLWRSHGAKVVAPESAAFAVTGVMPTWSDYNLWVPCPIDVPLPLKRPGDETEFAFSGIKIKAIFAPGHSPDAVIYAMELNGRRVIFTGDIAFDDRRADLPLGSNILHRSWGSRENALRVMKIFRDRILPLDPEFNFTGHSAYANATAAWRRILEASEAALQANENK